MKKHFYILLSALLVGPIFCGVENVVELHRPNSGDKPWYSSEELLDEFFDNSPSDKLMDWRNPFQGFSMHVRKDDSIEIYSSFWDKIEGEKIEVFNPSIVTSLSDLQRVIDSIPRIGNPVGILVTSDVSLSESRISNDLLKMLYKPHIQVYYLRKSEQVAAGNVR